MQGLCDKILLALLAVQIGQIDVSWDECRLEANRGAIRTFGRCGFFKSRVEGAEIDVSLSTIGIQRLRLAVFGKNLIERRQLVGAIDTARHVDEAGYRFQAHGADRIA
jgi:hypothetical protein